MKNLLSEQELEKTLDYGKDFFKPLLMPASHLEMINHKLKPILL